MKKKWSLLALLALCFVMFATFGCAYVYAEESYVVTFTNGDEVISTGEYKKGVSVEFPENPERPSDETYDYVFLGWNFSGEETDEFITSYTAEADATIYAVFKSVPIPRDDTVTHLVTFRDGVTNAIIGLHDPETGEMIYQQYVPDGSAARYPTEKEIPDHTDIHKVFKAWSEPEGAIITARTEIYATYKAQEYPVHLHVLGNDYLSEMPVEYEALLVLPKQISELGNPDLTDNVFSLDGWYWDEAKTQRILIAPQVNEDLLKEHASENGFHLYADCSLKDDFGYIDVRASDASADFTYGMEISARVRDLNDAKDLTYSYEWAVTRNGREEPSSEEVYTLHNAGDYTITCNVHMNYGDGLLTAVHTLTYEGTVTVAKAVITPTVTIDKTSLTYGEAAPAITATYEGLQFDDQASIIRPTYRYHNNTLSSDYEAAKLFAGSYTLTAQYGELENYTVSVPDALMFNVAKKSIRLSVAVEDHTYGKKFAPALSGFEGLEYGEAPAVLGEPIYTVNETERKVGDILPAGNNCRVTVSGLSSPNYSLNSNITDTFSVAKRPFNIRTTAADSMYGVAPQYGYEIELLGDDYEIDDARRDAELSEIVPTFAFTRSGSVYTSTQKFRAGDYVVTAQLGSEFANYLLSSISEANFTVTKAPLGISIDLAQTFTYGDPVSPKIVYDGFVYEENEAVLHLPASGTRWTYQSADGEPYRAINGVYRVGTYTVLLDQSFTADNYTITFEDDAKASFKVEKKALTATVNLDKDAYTYGETPRPATGEGLVNGIAYEGFITGESIVTLFPNILERPSIHYYYNGETETSSSATFHAGDYTATLSFDPENYSLTVNPVSFTVAQKAVSLSVTFTNTTTGGGYVYGRTPTYTRVYEGFLYGEGDRYMKGADLKYTGTRGKVYLHSELTSSNRIAADSYTVSVEGVGSQVEYNDYIVTVTDGAELVISPAPLSVSFSGNRSTYTYGSNPSLSVLFSGFVSGENESTVFTEQSRAIKYYFNGTPYTLTGTYYPAGSYRATLEGLQEQTTNYTVTLTEAEYTINRRPLSVTFTADNTSFTYGEYAKEKAFGSAQALTFTPKYSGFASGESESNLSGALVYAYQYRRSSSAEYAAYDKAGYFDAGYYQITASGLTSDNYTITFPTTLSVTVNRRAANVTAHADTQTYGTPLLAGEKYSYTTNVLDEDLDGFAFSYVFTTRALNSSGSYTSYDVPKDGHFVAGSYNLTIGYTENPNYNLTVTAAQFDVERKEITLSVVLENSSYTYGETPMPKVALSESTPLVYDEAFADLGDFAFTYTGENAGKKNSYALFNVGSYTVTASNDAIQNYTFTLPTATFTVEKKALTVSLSAQSFIYGGELEAEYTVEGFVEEEKLTTDYFKTNGRVTTSILLEDSQVSGRLHANTNGNSYTWRVSGFTTDSYIAKNYALENVYETTFTVSPKPLAAELMGVDDAYVYGKSPAPSITFDGFVDEADKNAFRATPIYKDGKGDGVTKLTVGSYVATIDYAENSDYSFTAPQKSFKVTPAELTVTITASNQPQSGYVYGAVQPTFRVAFSGYAYGEDAAWFGNVSDVVFDYKKEGSAYTLGARFDAGSYTATPNAETLTHWEELGENNYTFSVTSAEFKIAARQATVTVRGMSGAYNYGKALIENYEGATITPAAPKGITGILEEDVKAFGFKPALEDISDASLPAKFFDVGAYTITAEYMSNPNYEITIKEAKFTVAPVKFNLAATPPTIKATHVDVWSLDYSTNGYSVNSDFTLYGKILFQGADHEAGTYKADNKAEFDSYFRWDDGFKIKYNGEVVYDSENPNKNFEVGYALTVTITNLTFVHEITGSTNQDGNHGKTYNGVEETYKVIIKLEEGEETEYTLTYMVDGEPLESGAVPTFTNAGEYKVVCKVTGVGIDEQEIPYTVKINPALLTVTNPGIISQTYNKTPLWTNNGVQVTGVNGETFNVTYSWTRTLDGEAKDPGAGLETIINAGTYSVTATIKAAEGVLLSNYVLSKDGDGMTAKGYTMSETDITGDFTLTISPKSLSGKFITPTNAPDYNGESHTWTVTFEEGALESGDILSIGYQYQIKDGDNVEEVVNAGNYTVTYTASGDSSENYTDLFGTFDVTVNKAKTLKLKNALTGYNGSYDGGNHFEVISENNVTGLYDGDKVNSITYSKQEAGKYSDTLSIVNVSDGGTVYYKVDAGDNYEVATGYYTITITQVKGEITIPDTIKKEFTYTGKQQEVDLSDVTANFGTSTLTFAASKTTLTKDTTGKKFTFQNVNDANNATITITLPGTENYTQATQTISISVKKAKTLKLKVTPTGYNGGYDGDNHFEVISEDNVDGLFGSDKVNSITYSKQETGEYSDKLSIVNVSDGGTVYYKVDAGDNYEVATGSYTITITPKELTVTADNIEEEYNGENHFKPITITGYVKGEDETASVTYSVASADKDSIINVNTYTVSYSIATNNSNYTVATSSTGSYTIKITPATLTVTANSVTEEYDGGNHFKPITEKDNVTGLYDGDKVNSITYSKTGADESYGSAFEIINVSDVGTVYYKVDAGSNYVVATGSYTVTITPATLTVNTPGDATATYDGADHFAGVTVEGYKKETDKSGTTVQYSKDNAAFSDTLSIVNVSDGGTVYYQVTSSSNYTITNATGNYSITITPAATLKVTANSVTEGYNGDNHFQAVTVEGYKKADDEGKTTISYSMTGEEDTYLSELSIVDVKDGGYVVYYKVDAGDNYVVVKGDYTITIEKATYDMEGVGAWNYTDPFTYDSTLHTVALTKRPLDVKGQPLEATYKNNSAKDANTYIATATFDFDTKNYFIPETREWSCTWKINKATTLKLKVAPTDYNGGYDGTDHFEEFKISKDNVDGLYDGDSVTSIEYAKGMDESYSATPTFINAGTYEVWYEVNAGDNYEVATGSYTVTITKATWEWRRVDDTALYYTGDKQGSGIEVPSPIPGNTPKITYSEDSESGFSESVPMFINANTYTVYFKITGSDNYEDKNGSYTITIDKAKAVPDDNKPTTIEDVVRGVGKTIGEVAFPEGMKGYYWTDDSKSQLLGTGDTVKAEAYYNPDPANYYNSDSFEVTITTRKERITIELTTDTLEAKFEGAEAALKTDAVAKANITRELLGELSNDEKALISAALDGVTTYTIGSTYLATVTFTITDNEYFEFEGKKNEKQFDNIVVKIQSVQISGDNDTWYTIEDALANAGSGTITVKNNTAFATTEIAKKAGYSVEGGNYTVRDGIRLILPYDKDKAEHKTDRNYTRYALDTPSQFLKLELYLPKDIVLYNNGNIVIGGITTGGNGGNSIGNGQTSSDYAQIKLGANAGIESDGEIYAWGFITEESNGNGSFVNVTSGNIQVPFIVIEHRGGTEFQNLYLAGLNGAPFNRFFMQNITAYLTINYGATLIGYADLYAASSDNTTIIRLVGSKTSDMISLKQGARVEAKYNTTTKVTELIICGSFVLHDLALSVASFDLSTSKVLFPISWYWNITLLPEEEGKVASVDATSQGIKLLPGAKLTIGKGVVLNAKDVAVYETFTDFLVSTNKKYESNLPAELTVNGTLNVQNIGGTVLNTEDGAVLNIISSTKVTSYEVTKSGTYTPTEYVLKIKHNVEDAIDDQPTEQREKGVFEAKDGGWQVADTATNYRITYKFVFDTEEKMEAITNNNPEQYTINDNIDLQNVSFEGWVFIGWYLDNTCTEQPIYTIQGSMKRDVTLYGLFKQVNSYVFNYKTQQGGITIESDVVIADDLASFDLSVHDTQIKIYDDELTQKQYFDGWWLDEQCTKPFNVENVLALGSGVNFEVQLYAKWSTKQTLKINITNVNVIINGNSYEKTATLYVKPGTVVNISLTAVDNAIGEKLNRPKGTIDSASISGADWSGSHDERSGTYSFVMPNGEVEITLKGTAQACIVEGTLITLADGTQKKVEDLQVGDMVLIFNHETGRYEAAPLLFNTHDGSDSMMTTVVYAIFSDGTELGIVGEHALFDVDLNRYVFLHAGNAAEYIGHRFVRVVEENGEFVTRSLTMTDVRIEEKCVKYYSPVSLFHLNVVTNGLLSYTAFVQNSEGFVNYFTYDEDMKFNEEAMQADIEKYGLYTYEDFKDVMTEDLFEVGPWKYFKIAVGKGHLTWEDIMAELDFILHSGEV